MLKLKNYKNNLNYIYIVNTALIYSNNKIHLGHLMENIIGDIFYKYLSLIKKKVYFLGGVDTHGTPTMLKSIKEKKSINYFIKNFLKKNKKLFEYFNIKYDNYFDTNNNKNKIYTRLFFSNLKKKNLILKKKLKSFYDKNLLIFLQDRFVKGVCPYCYKYNQYCDVCDVCKKSFLSIKLLKPYSIFSKTKPIKKKVYHYFLLLSHNKCYFFIKNFINKIKINNNIKELKNILNKKYIKNWDISRNYPYFGFNFNKKSKNYFYVWFDALIGYITNLKIIIKKNLGKNYFLNNNFNFKYYYFIGKDILYFHFIYLPVIFKYNNLNTKIKIFTHGFLCIKKKKVSKSKNIFIDIKNYIVIKLNPDYIRYYLANKINGNNKNINFDINDFFYKINKDLIGKYINIPSRISNFICNFFKKKLSKFFTKNIFLKKFFIKIFLIKKNYKNLKYNKVIGISFKLIKIINNYIEKKKPWEIKNLSIKNLHKICTISLQSYKIILFFLKPILPYSINKLEKFLKFKIFKLKNIKKIINSKFKIKIYKYIMKKITLKEINFINNV